MNEAFSEHLRLTILRLLSGAPAYTANSSILHSAVLEFGFSATRDQIRTELAWLEEQRCLKTRTLEGLVVATLTERGQDCAEGRCRIPGIQSPAARG